MAHKNIDRCKETASTAGTGTFTLAGAVAEFVGVCNATNGLTADGDTGYFEAKYGTEWEIFLGTRVDATHLARTNPPISSSNAGAQVNFSAPPVIFSTVPGSKLSEVGPAFRANRATSSHGITTSSWAKVQLNAVDFDTSGCFDSTTNYRFQPNVAGYYDARWCISMSPTSGNAGISASSLYKNGVEYSRGGQINPSTATIAAIFLSGADLVYLNGSTDYLEIFAYMVATSPLVNTGTYFAGHFVRRA